MPIYKNVASQKLAVYAYDPTTAPGTDPSKTGDAANITAQISKDGGVSAATNDVNPTELDATDHPGIYIFDLTQAETNADMIIVSAKSATANILLDPVEAFTTPGDNAALNANLTEIEGDTQSATDLKDFADSGYDPSTNKVQGVVLVDTTTTNSDMRGTDSAALASNVPDSLSHANLKIQLVTDYHLDHLLAADYDPASKPGVATALLNELIESDSGVSRLTANALEQGPVATGFSTHSAADVWTSGTRTLTGLGFTFVAGDFGSSSLDGKGDWNTTTPPTAASVADAIWDEAQADHTSAGTFGEVATEIAAILVDTGTTLPAMLSTIDTIVDSILVDTAEIGSSGAGLTAVPWNSAWDAEVQSECTDALNAYDPPTKAELDSGLSGLNDPTAAEIWTSGTRTLTAATNITSSGEAINTTGGVVDTVTTATTATNLTTNNDKTGYAMSATGTDLVLVDGKTLPAAVRIIAAAVAGRVSGAGTGTEVFKGLDEATTRITATVDSSGNRTDLTYG